LIVLQNQNGDKREMGYDTEEVSPTQQTQLKGRDWSLSADSKSPQKSSKQSVPNTPSKLKKCFRNRNILNTASPTSSLSPKLKNRRIINEDGRIPGRGNTKPNATSALSSTPLTTTSNLNSCRHSLSFSQSVTDTEDFVETSHTDDDGDDDFESNDSGNDPVSSSPRTMSPIPRENVEDEEFEIETQTKQK